MNTRKLLPSSNGRYSIDAVGRVFDERTQEEILPQEINGHLCVKIDWIVDLEMIPCGLLVLIVNNRIDLPYYFYKEVLILYNDDDIGNLTAFNLTYRFINGPLEHPLYKGFYFIPTFAGYAISKDGDLINASNGSYKRWTMTPGNVEKNKAGGYLYSRLQKDEGVSRIIYLHRALGLAFIPYSKTPDRLTINHKDGNPLNNLLDNLEWTTYSENNLHAISATLRTSNLRPVVVKNKKTKEETKFFSLTSCAKSLGLVSGQDLSRKLARNDGKFENEKYIIEQIDSESIKGPVHIPPSPLRGVDYYNNDYHMLARDIFTGEIIAFYGVDQGEAITGIPKSSILTNAVTKTPVPIGKYNFRFTTDVDLWPKHTKEQLLIYHDNPERPVNGVYVYDVLNQSTRFFTNVNAAINDLKINPTLARKMINTDNLILNRYQLKEFNVFEEYNRGPLVK